MPNSVKLQALFGGPNVTLSGVRAKLVSPGALVVGISAGRGISSVATFRLPLPLPGSGSGGGGNAPGGAGYGVTAGASAGGGAAVSSLFGWLDCARAGPAASATSATVVSSDFVSLPFIFSGPPKP